MLQRRRQLQVFEMVAVRPFDERHGHARGEIWVLAKRFVNPAPERMAADVDDR
jgi:hypothetical protein